ncbi:MAG: HNH endonuclease signature motif containing protein [Bacteroidales bacterium]|nr:HNH endonuclease signature motif containing protein [Bacteroidales bacterium]
MNDKPYKFSKKAGRYVSKTQTGNRSYYYRLLISIEPSEEFDPNSTFGKYIMGKTIFDLKKYKNIKNDINNLSDRAAQQSKYLNQVQKENRYEETRRRNKAIDEITTRIVVNKYLIIAHYKVTALIISIALLGLYYGSIDSFIGIMWLFSINYIVLVIVGKFIYSKLKNEYQSQAEIEIKNQNFSFDLKGKEKKIQDEINITKSEIRELKKQLFLHTLQLKLKLFDLLDDEKLRFILSDQFYNSTDWKKIREQALSLHENVCVFCGNTETITVDHISPRSKYPELALDINNTQILCINCNRSKGNRC